MLKHLPELPEWELNNMMMTIFGMLQPGHPLILGVKHLYQDVMVDGVQHKYSPFHRGNMIIRFFNNAVAQHFIDCVNGVEVFYENFQIVKNLAPHLKSNPGAGERGWYQTRIKAEFVNSEYGFPRFDDSEWLVNELRELMEGSPEKLLWQAWLPSKDHEMWLKDGPRWMVNTCSGVVYERNVREARQGERVDPLIHVPDASYWDAVGRFSGIRDGTIKCRGDAIGAWEDHECRRQAEMGDTFTTRGQIVSDHRASRSVHPPRRSSPQRRSRRAASTGDRERR